MENKKIVRLLDANLNRAREGLRVVEDTARFVWDDSRMYQRLRTLRHRLHEVTECSYKDLVEARDSGSDAGRKIKEGLRATLGAVVAANLRRAQEAVRVLEEYGKIVSPTAAPAFKQIRFQLYQEEKKILKRI